MLPSLSHMLAASNPLEHVLPHELVPGIPFITNQMLMATIAALLMLLIFPALFRKVDSSAPTGSKNFFEAIMEFLRVEVFRPALKENTDRFLPFLWTMFFFILFCNLLGYLPIGEVLGLLSGGKLSHIGGTATGTLSTTAALSVCVFFCVHVSGITQVYKALRNGSYGHHDHAPKGKEDADDLQHMRGEALAAEVPGDLGAVGNPTAHYADGEHGGKRVDHHDVHDHAEAKSAGQAAALAVPLYLWNFAPHPFRTPGASTGALIADTGMWAFLLVLELLGAVIKPFALSLRLFANMIAGHIVLAVLAGLILLAPTFLGQLGIAAPVIILSLLVRFLELFVSFLQSYIFVFLSTLFLASAIAPEH